MISAFSAVCTALEGARVETHPAYLLFVCPQVGLPQFSGVWAERDGGEAVADLGWALSEIERLGMPFWLQTREGRHPLVEEEAGRLGLELADRFSGMAASASAVATPPMSTISIERVTDREGLSQAAQVADAGFEVPPGTFAPLYDQRVAETPGIAYYVGRLHGEPVATALHVLHADAVGIFNVATLPGCRGRGFGSALTARAAQDGCALGARLVCLQASPLGEPVYRRMGFRSVGTYNLFTRV
jgi:GNAT superfamily N-acetyltransferase